MKSQTDKKADALELKLNTESKKFKMQLFSKQKT